MVELEILYQDEHCVAVLKPTGLLVHRSLIDKYETQFAMQILRDQLGQKVYPLHRLDKATSGILLFALSAESAKKIAKQFEQNQVHKAYIAIVRGYLKDSGRLDYPLKEKLDKMVDKKARQDKPPQTAVTDFTGLGQVELPYSVGRYNTARYSIVKLEPKTGRKHQLRRHMAHLRHPILGDVNYGDNKHNRFVREQMGFNGLALCARKIEFSHPFTGAHIIVQTKVETRFMQLLSKWGMAIKDIQEIWSN